MALGLIKAVNQWVFDKKGTLLSYKLKLLSSILVVFKAPAATMIYLDLKTYSLLSFGRSIQKTLTPFESIASLITNLWLI